MEVRPVRVALVEDDKEIRELLQSGLERAEGIQVVRSFPNAEDFLDVFEALAVDVVLMDINLPGKSGIDCIREAKPTKPSVQFLVLTVFENPAYIFQALCAGATGYLVKNEEPEQLHAAIHDIHAGGSPMAPAIARLVVASFQREVQVRIQDHALTEREKNVLDQLANGLMYKEIAAKAEISTETVRKHVRNIYDKLQVSSRMEAIRKVYPGASL
ncbi:MAG TPA: response regulator transcription factor [Flavobacteriales bacterium]|nr:response regulator transcription factor [Flavobacteriales bacterium]